MDSLPTPHVVATITPAVLRFEPGQPLAAVMLLAVGNARASALVELLT